MRPWPPVSSTFSVDWEKQWHPEIGDPEVALPHFARVLRQYVAAAPTARGTAAAVR